MSARGGARDGAGRPKGAATRRTQEIAARALEEGISPVEVMLANMRFAHEKAEGLLVKLLDSGVPPPEGFDALKALLGFREIAQKCAEGAAPYLHPRLSAVAVLDAGGEADEDGKVIEHDAKDHLAHIAKRYAGGLTVIEGSGGKK